MSTKEAINLIRAAAALKDQAKVEQLVERCGLSGAKRQRAIDSLTDERLRGKPVAERDRGIAPCHLEPGARLAVRAREQLDRPSP